MKKIIASILTVSMLAGVLTACGGADSTAVQNTLESAENVSVADGKKLSIITTIFPEYDWVRNILGENADNAEVTMLLDNGVDLHSYQPTAEDIMKISTCDMLIYVGGESDEWVEDALKEASNPNMVKINLLEMLGDKVKEEEVVEGMQEEEHDHSHGDEDESEEHEHEHDHEGEAELDEHVWLSLRNAQSLVTGIAKKLAEIDDANGDIYKANAQMYCEELFKLDAEYEETVKNADKNTILFGDRFPFRYMVDDYGLDYYAAFVGCSAETEASFETIIFLSNKVDELGLNTILTIETSDGRIAETICENTGAKNQEILSMDSMQSVTAADVEKGASYISIMESNLEALKAALK